MIGKNEEIAEISGIKEGINNIGFTPQYSLAPAYASSLLSFAID